VIVVTDGSRILGLGDLGANGMGTFTFIYMYIVKLAVERANRPTHIVERYLFHYLTGIPVGKLSLYCAAGGIAPHRVLPIVLDVGTNNEELLNDEFYLGVQKKRLRGAEYFHMVDEFMEAVRFRWPNVLVQFEDFDSSVAQTLLDKYRHKQLCFNDDIQGTGATTLAGLLCALRAKGVGVEALGDQKIVIAGAGSAGIGISQVLMQAMVEQGRSEEEAKNAIYVCDKDG
jgi:malate dehydrogenase (oxaloacetate-decarboxylating)(NADP+)